MGRKKPLGIFPGSDYVPVNIGAGPVDAVVESQRSQSESLPGERFQNAGPFKRDSLESCAAADRRVNESLNYCA